MVTTETADAETITVEAAVAVEVSEETTTAEDLEEMTEHLEAAAKEAAVVVKEEANLSVVEEAATETPARADVHLEELILQLQEREDLEEAKNYFI